MNSDVETQALLQLAQFLKPFAVLLLGLGVLAISMKVFMSLLHGGSVTRIVKQPQSETAIDQEVKTETVPIVQASVSQLLVKVLVLTIVFFSIIALSHYLINKYSGPTISQQSSEIAEEMAEKWEEGDNDD